MVTQVLITTGNGVSTNSCCINRGPTIRQRCGTHHRTILEILLRISTKKHGRYLQRLTNVDAAWWNITIGTEPNALPSEIQWFGQWLTLNDLKPFQLHFRIIRNWCSIVRGSTMMNIKHKTGVQRRPIVLVWILAICYLKMLLVEPNGYYKIFEYGMMRGLHGSNYEKSGPQTKSNWRKSLWNDVSIHISYFKNQTRYNHFPCIILMLNDAKTMLISRL